MAELASTSSLTGQFLIAMPGMEDERFERSLIYMCAHSDDGAMGLIVNQAVDEINFPDLLVQLDVIDERDQITLPEMARDLTVHRGGPVETGRGFVLHTSDYKAENSTLEINEAISLTATLDILKAIANGHGPSGVLLALGYAGWGPNQLEQEIVANGWLNVDCDPEVIFNCRLEERYTKALKRLGIDLAMLSGDAGRA